ncbi:MULTISPECIES: hypothetical protein [unclassified Marinobacterium]|uniref:hypothetical protein n=1 Tax=unclassified Marinobacterium TaxID=2644139 RepID=UPI001568F176|nr:MULTISPECIES: hypothetical protein [unclassified Marinobacterium]NRP10379.1 hypothetical protein [Marinobacterium sp. xm-g-48]NRP83478.1 hypothetical protein [Marinobacterium sp. xm-d-509]
MTDALNLSNQAKAEAARQKLIDKIEVLEKALNEVAEHPLGELSKCKSVSAIAKFEGFGLKAIHNRKTLDLHPDVKARYEDLAGKVQSYNPTDSKEVRDLRKRVDELRGERDTAVLVNEKLVETLAVHADRERSALESLDSALAKIDRLESQNQKLLKERDELRKAKASGRPFTVVS